VADDDDFNFFVIESLLSPYSYRIIHARNGEEAVEMFRSQQDISLILMDIQMPVMDGFTATKEIRKLDDKIPIIVQTAYTINKVKEMAMNCGCNDFLTKPIDADLLIRKIESCINN
jgi:two-component system, cell cycle response regulator DivK